MFLTFFLCLLVISFCLGTICHVVRKETYQVEVLEAICR